MSSTRPTIQLVKRPRAFDAKALLRGSVGAASATYRRSDVIYFQGDVADSVFYLQAGSVKLSVSSHSGKEGVVAMLKAGDFFGESALAGRPVRLETATAVTAVTLVITPKAQMIRLLHGNHALSDRFIAYLLARHTRMESDLVDHLLNSSEKRLARVLLMLAHSGGPGKAHRVLPRISQTTLAEMVGTTRSRVNVFMNRFKSRGFIEDEGGLRINSSLLTVVLGDDRQLHQRKAG